jgi:hypothetical protein
MVGSQDATNVLKHPLTLLVLGGVLTSIVGPFITRAWQNHERELEVKSELVDQMSQATAALMTSVHVREFNPGRYSEDEFLEAFRQWDERSQVIDARLATYFPDNEGLSQGWGDLSRALFDYYNLGSANRGKIDQQARLPNRCDQPEADLLTFRPSFLCAIGRYLQGRWNNLPYWRKVNLFQHRTNDVKYREGWRELKEALIERRDQLVRQVIASDASV